MLHKKTNLQSIQFLRGIACLLVVFLHISETYLSTYHTFFLGNIFRFGGAGVDIFFVLSGFIITYSNSRFLTQSSSIIKFIMKRIIRIFPIYWIIISFLLLMQVALPFFYRTHYQFTGANLLNTYLLLPNHNMVNGVSWTLTNELFFYLLFTISLLVPQKKYSIILLFIYLGILLLFPILPLSKNSINNFTDAILFPMNIEFLLGIIIVLLMDKLPKNWCIPLLVTGVVLFIFGAIFTNSGKQVFTNSYNRVLLFGLPSFIIILALVKYELTTKIYIHNLFIKLGDASYSIYLFHLPLVAAFFKIMVKLNVTNYTQLLLLIAGLLVTIYYMGIAIYEKIEIPIIKWLNRA